ncbi:MAG: hypothetical protein ACRERS_10830 [Methylococcales bacterium]
MNARKVLFFVCVMENDDGNPMGASCAIEGRSGAFRTTGDSGCHRREAIPVNE